MVLLPGCAASERRRINILPHHQPSIKSTSAAIYHRNVKLNTRHSLFEIDYTRYYIQALDLSILCSIFSNADIFKLGNVFL